ncbi:MAG: TetR/AcrR family transcriptional regulator [Myxococcota bacterium]
MDALPLEARLVDVGLALLEEEGVEALTLRRVARAAGVSHGAPLRHFRSLADFKAELASHGFERLHGAVEKSGAQLAPGAGALARLKVASRAYVDCAVAHPGLFALMFRPGEIDDDNERFRRHAPAAFEHVVQLVRFAQDSGWQPERETRELAGAVWAGVHGVASLWNQGAVQGAIPGASLEAVLTHLIELMIQTGTLAERVPTSPADSHHRTPPTTSTEGASS